MLDGRYKRGFSNDRFDRIPEPKVRKDEFGYFMMSLSENTKVYFDDYYAFLERTFLKAGMARDEIDKKISETAPDSTETLAFYRAKGVIVDLLMRTVIRFYTDGSNLGIIMSPWCFGTVVLEKTEVYRDRISKGEVDDPNVPEYPFYVTRYIDEIYKATLLELLDFPEEAFKMRWQYSELLKRYSGILSNITTQLQSVLANVRQLGA